MVWHYRVRFQGPKSARSGRDNGRWLPSIRLQILETIYTANFITISPVFGPWWTRMWNKVPISLCISIKYDGLTLPRLLSRPQKCQKLSRLRPLAPVHSFANIINYICSKFHNDRACIWVVMDQNVKQCSDSAFYFYQIRWFDITAFASKAPKVQEVVDITASGSPPFVCKYYNLYIQQIS